MDADTFTITVRYQEAGSSNQYERTVSFKIKDLEKTPNPRQALMSHFRSLGNEVLEDGGSSFHIPS